MKTRSLRRYFFQKLLDWEVTQCSWSARHVVVCHRRYAWRWRGTFNLSGILLQVSWQNGSMKGVFWFSFFLFQPTGQTEFAIRKNMKSPHTDVFVEDKHQSLPISFSSLCKFVLISVQFLWSWSVWRCQQFLHQNKIIWWFGSLFDAIDSNCTIWWIKNTASWIILRFQSHVPPKSIPSNSTKLCLCHNYLYQRQSAKEPTFHIGCLEIRIVEHQGGI